MRIHVKVASELIEVQGNLESYLLDALTIVDLLHVNHAKNLLYILIQI